MEIISPMYDFMFKKMFSLPDSKDMLCDFLSSYIDLADGELKDVKLIDKEMKRSPDDKDSILDLRIEVGTPDNKLTEIDVEVQLRNQISFGDRASYYLAKMYSDQLSEGDSYLKLHRCVSLCIVNFSLFDDEEYFRRMLMRDERGNVLTDKFELDCVEISKIRKLQLTPDIDRKLQWAKLFAAKSEEELNMITAQVENPAIDKAVLTIKKLSATEEMRYEAFVREKAERDRITRNEEDLILARQKGLAEGRAEGRAEGEAMGIAKGRAEAISEATEIFTANLRAMGMSEAQIQMALGLSPAQPMGNYISAEAHDDDYTPEP